MQVSLSGWLQNFVCLDIQGDILANRRNKIMHHDGITSLVIDLTPTNKINAEKKSQLYNCLMILKMVITNGK